MEKLFKGNFFIIFFLSAVTFSYVDFISKSSFGVLFSIFLFVFLLIISVKNLDYGIILAIAYSLLVVEFPRDILDAYEDLQVYGIQSYNVINTVKIGPFTLLVYLLFINSFFALKKISPSFFTNVYILPLIFLFVIGFVSMYRVLLNQGFLYNARLLITDIKFILFIFSGIIQGVYIYKRGLFYNLRQILFVIPIIIGLRTVFFVLNDFYNGNSTLDLMTSPYLSLSVFVYILIKGEWGIYKNYFYRFLLFLSLLNPSRGFVLLLVVFVGLGFFLGRGKKISFKMGFLLQITGVLTLVSGLLFFFNERLYDFFVWKLEVFDELFDDSIKLSGSGQVRATELYNIYKGLSESYYELLFGRGFGATYDFSYRSLGMIDNIDLKSFSKDQLESGVYYTSHSFFTSNLLKYGFVGVLLYLFYPITLGIAFFKKFKDYFFLLFPIILIYSYYFRIEFMILMGVFIGIRISIKNR